MRLSPAFAFKAADVSEEGVFSGRASTYGGPADAYGHIIAPGAFRASLATHKQMGTMPGLLWAHDPAEPIGRWLSIAEDDKGLLVRGKLTLSLQRARDAYALMKDGALGLSIGVMIPDGAMSCDYEIRSCTISQADLFEISVTPVPANRRATIDSVKSTRGCVSVPELQRYFLDSMGVSRGVARKLACACENILKDGTDTVEREEIDLEPAMRSIVRQFKSLSKLYSE